MKSNKSGGKLMENYRFFIVILMISTFYACNERKEDYNVKVELTAIARCGSQMNFYFDRGYRVGGVAWFEPSNVLDILLAGEKKGNQFIGIMHTAWASFDQSLNITAEANWTGGTILGKLKF